MVIVYTKTILDDIINLSILKTKHIGISIMNTIVWNQKFSRQETENAIVKFEGRSHQQIYSDIIDEVNKTAHKSKKDFVSAYIAKKHRLGRA